MTSKERVMTAMRCEVPDRVPVVLGVSEGIPVKKSGLNYIEFFLKEKAPMWKARVETASDLFGADGYVHVGWGNGPNDPEREQVIRSETDDEVVYDIIVHTPHGDLTETLSVGKDHTISTISGLIKNPEAEMEKVVSMLQYPHETDWSEFRDAYEWAGDRAMVGLWIATPWDWWVSLRGGPQAAIMDTFDNREALDRIFQIYTEYAAALLERAFSEATIDSVGLGGSSTSMSVISPKLHRQLSLPFGKVACDICRKHDVPTQYHMCGKSRDALEITAEMGVAGFDALESPPTGNVDLAEVKKTFGDSISLKGNVNSITVMLNGTPDDVRNDVIRCMDSAKEGGGYICSVGDQCPVQTPDENIFAMVDAVKEFGAY